MQNFLVSKTIFLKLINYNVWKNLQLNFFEYFKYIMFTIILYEINNVNLYKAQLFCNFSGYLRQEEMPILIELKRQLQSKTINLGTLYLHVNESDRGRRGVLSKSQAYIFSIILLFI